MAPELTAAISPAPSASDDIGSLDAAHSPLRVHVLANDVENFSTSALSITAVGQPAHGTAVIDGADIVYTATADFPGTDEFSYTISDKFGTTATAKVSIGELSAAAGSWRGVVQYKLDVYAQVRVTVSAGGELTGAFNSQSNPYLRFSFRGTLGSDGTFSGRGPGTTGIYYTFTFDPQTGNLGGIVGYEIKSTIRMSRLATASNPTPWAGSYTYINESNATFTGSPGPAPLRIGWGTIRVTPLGNVHLAGYLPDGGRLVIDGTLFDSVCFFESGVIYPGFISGQTNGYFNLDPNAQYQPSLDEPTELNGTLNQVPCVAWSRTVRRPGVYPARAPQYRMSATFTVSRYVPSNVPLPFGLANADSIIYQEISWPAGNQIRAVGPNPSGLVIQVNPNNGLFHGSFRDPQTHISYVLGGAILEDQKLGYGSCTGGGQNTWIVLTP